MHSKVIIASLVCLLAAGFGNLNAINNVKLSSDKTNTTYNCAPNAEGYDISFQKDYGVVGELFRATIVFDEEHSNFGIIDQSPLLAVSYRIIRNRALVTGTAPRDSGSYYAKFGYTVGTKQIVLASIYVYSNGTNFYVSSLSKNAAKAKFFKKYYVGERDRELLFGPMYPGHPFEDGDYDTPFPDGPIIRGANGKNMKSIVSEIGGAGRAGFGFGDGPIGTIGIGDFLYRMRTLADAERDYGKYVYGENDVTINASATPRTTTNFQSTLYTNFNIHVNWEDKDGNTYPAKGINVGLYRNDEREIGYYDPSQVAIFFDPYAERYTDENGSYSIKVATAGPNILRRDIFDVKLYSKSVATDVMDSNGISYPIVFHEESTLTGGSSFYRVSDCEAIDYYITIKTDTSDRANAYEIAQAQLVPFNYAKRYAGDVSSVDTQYPADNSGYTNTITGNKKVMIKENDFHNWDLLNHEYSHYICDELDLCVMPSERTKHKTNEDLIAKYGLEEGMKIAFSEGLATYLAIASQMYCASNPNIAGFGDMIYDDPFRNITIDYSDFLPPDTNANDVCSAGVEQRITNVLLKLLDDEERVGDSVALGHQKMWESISYQANQIGANSSINQLLQTILRKNSSLNDEIKTVLRKELFLDLFTAPIAQWTVMLYMSGSGLLDRALLLDINEMLSVPNQPSNVNVLLEIGGAPGWSGQLPSDERLARYHLNDGQLVLDEELPDTSLGKESTFENFLEWGLTRYPASHTGVIFWGHGGATFGCCSDGNHSYDTLLASETSAAYQAVFQRHGISKLNFVGYDSCIMQAQDVADFNSQYFDYMIASQENEWGYGWLYNEWLDDLYTSTDTLFVLKQIVDSYVPNSESNSTLSILDLSKMENYKNAFEALAFEILCDGTFTRSNIENLVFSKRVPVFGGSLSNHGLVDGYYLLLAMDSSPYYYRPFHQYIDSAIDAYLDVVIYNRTGVESSQAKGLSVYIPQIGRNFFYYDSETNFDNWRTLLGAPAVPPPPPNTY